MYISQISLPISMQSHWGIFNWLEWVTFSFVKDPGFLRSIPTNLEGHAAHYLRYFREICMEGSDDLFLLIGDTYISQYVQKLSMDFCKIG